MTWDSLTVQQRIFETANLLASDKTFPVIALSLGTTRNAIAGIIHRHRSIIDLMVAAIRRGESVEVPVLEKKESARQRRKNLTLVKARPDECRYPLWSGRAPDPKKQFVCGGVVTNEKRVYCDEHHQACHTALRPPRVHQADWMPNPPKKGLGMSLTDRAFGLSV